MESNKSKRVTKILLVLYLIFITWVILFKMSTDFQNIGTSRRINLKPFGASVIINGKIDLSEIYLNIAAFMPLGIYVSALKENWNFIQKAAPAFFVSLAFETAQYILAVGVTDITDLLGNTLGGVIGVAFYWFLSKILKDQTIKVINILAAAGTVCILALAGILLVFNW